jgi:uncharacterized protein (DUF2147 family)
MCAKKIFQYTFYPFRKLTDKAAIRATTLIMLVCSAIGLSAQSDANTILGKWENSERGHVVEVVQQGDTYSASILQSEKAGETGKRVAWGLRFDSKEKEWAGGEVQLPEMKHSASCYATLKGNDTLIITGYHGFRFLGSSKTFKRVKA